MAKTEVKNIVVALKARIGNFKKKISNAGKSISNLTKRAGAGIKKFVKFGAVMAVAAAAAAAAMAAMAKRSIDSMDRVGKLSDELGISTEALIGLKHAAEINGAGLDNLQKGLQIYTRRLGEAKMGMGEGVKGLELLGLSADEMAKKPLEEQFKNIADGIKGLPTQAERAAAAYHLFSRQGSEMINLLQAGGGEIQKLMTEAGTLGLTYDRQTAGIAEQINDTMTRIKATFSGAWQQILANTLPAIDRISGAVLNWTQTALPNIKAGFVAIIAPVKAVFSWYVKNMLPYVVKGTKFIIGGMIKGFTLFEAVAVNWKDSLNVVWKSVYLGLVKFYEGTKHFLTVAIPAYLDWFKNNWKNIFTDLWNGTKTIFINLFNNAKNLFTAIWSYLNGDGFDFEWTALTDGFKATCEKLPEIAKRTKTELETSLELDISKSAGKIKNYYNDKVKERMAFMGHMGTALKEQLGGAVKKAVKTGTKEGQSNTPKRKAAEKRQSTFGTLGSRVSLAGLAMSAGKDMQAKTASNTKATVDELKKVNKNLTAKSQTVTFVAS